MFIHHFPFGVGVFGSSMNRTAMFYVGGFHLRCPSLRRRGSGTADRRISSEGRSFLGTVVFEQNGRFVPSRRGLGATGGEALFLSVSGRRSVLPPSPPLRAVNLLRLPRPQRGRGTGGGGGEAQRSHAAQTGRQGSRTGRAWVIVAPMRGGAGGIQSARHGRPKGRRGGDPTHRAAALAGRGGCPGCRNHQGQRPADARDRRPSKPGTAAPASRAGFANRGGGTSRRPGRIPLTF